jgi:hypothetical protein
MRVKPIIDAGPGLNFLSLNRNASLSRFSGRSAHPRLSGTRFSASPGRTTASVLPQQCGAS